MLSERTADSNGEGHDAHTTVITVRGTGLDPLTIDWGAFGDPKACAKLVTGHFTATGYRPDTDAEQP